MIIEQQAAESGELNPEKEFYGLNSEFQGKTSSTRDETYFPIAMQDVNPGDSMPIRLTRPG
jgi:hypothetical protein